MKKILILLLCAAVGLGLLSGCADTAPSDTAGQAKAALLLVDDADRYGAALEEGAMRAASELGIEVVDLSAGADAAGLPEQIRSAVSSGCGAIVAAGSGTEPVMVALQEAADAGVKLVWIDSPAGAASAATVATDHRAAGRAAGEAMLEVLEQKKIKSGEIGIIGVNENDDAAALREAGFREMFEGKSYTLLELQYGEGDTAKAQTIAEKNIRQGVVGIFGCDGSSAVGAGTAVREAGSKAVVIGFGDADAVSDLMEDGSIRGMVTQKADVIGYEGMKAAAALLKGEDLSGVQTDIGVSVVLSEAPVTGNNDYKIALIAVDRLDQRWIAFEEGAMKAASELGCEIVNMSPKVRDNAHQAEQISNAVSSGYHAIVLALDEVDEALPALQEAVAAGVKVICADVQAPVEGVLMVSIDNKEAGRSAGAAMISALEKLEITEGPIGIINGNADRDFALLREEGFREAFEGTGYTLLETQCSEGDAAKSHTIAERFLAQKAVGIFCGSKGCTYGVGNAVKEKHADTVVIGFDVSDVIQKMIDEGVILATVVQNSGVIGYESVITACKVLSGENPGDTVIVDTAVSLQSKKLP